MEACSLLLDAGAPIYGANRLGETCIELATGGTAAELRRAVAARLRRGEREANAALAARSRLEEQLRGLGRTDPIALNAMVCEDRALRTLLMRFGVDVRHCAGLDEDGRSAAEAMVAAAPVPVEAPDESMGEEGADGDNLLLDEPLEGDEPLPPMTARVTRHLGRLGDRLDEDIEALRKRGLV